MADFSVYGTMHNYTYYTFPAAKTYTPKDGAWKIKPGILKPGVGNPDDYYYQIENDKTCHGSQATFSVGAKKHQMSFKWSVACPRKADNFVNYTSLSGAVNEAIQAASGTGNYSGTVPPRGHPLYVKHYITHNPAGLLPTGTRQMQKQAFWCWAACISTIISYYRLSGNVVNSEYTQCKLVSDLLDDKGHLYDCCRETKKLKCLTTLASFTDVATLLNRAGITTDLYPFVAPSKTTITVALDNFNPIMALVAKKGTRLGHFIIIHGYSKKSDSLYLAIWDPVKGSGYYTYDQLINNYGDGSSVVGYALTSYPQPWLATEAAPVREAMKVEYEEFLDERQDILVVRIDLSQEALNNPVSSAKISYAQFQTWGLVQGSNDISIEKRLAFFNEENQEITHYYKGNDFIPDLKVVVDKAKKAANEYTEPHDVAFVPFLFLRVHALVIFNVATRRPKAVFVVPKSYETEFKDIGPYTPTVFLDSMKRRLSDLLKIGDTDEYVSL